MHLDGVELHLLVGLVGKRTSKASKKRDLNRSIIEAFDHPGVQEEDEEEDTKQKKEEMGKESNTFTVLKEKIKEILHRVERVEVSNVHILLACPEDKGKRELHLHIDKLRYEDVSQLEVATLHAQTSTEHPLHCFNQPLIFMPFSSIGVQDR